MSLVFPHTFVPWFRSVAPYIHAYKGETFVVAIAGEAIAAGKLNAVAPLAWMTDVLTKLVHLWPAPRIDELMPWAYAARSA